MPHKKLEIYTTHALGIEPFITKDGSIIRELMHPDHHSSERQSIAEATIPIRNKTLLHRHNKTEEIYHIKEGTGRMTLGNKDFTVAPNDTICIKPGTAHCIENIGEKPLVLLCCCVPGYSHEDTELLTLPFKKEQCD